MAYWQHNRSMSPRRFKIAVQRLGMSMAGAGRFLGISERRIRRMCVGQAIVPSAVVLLCSMIEHGEQSLVPLRPRWKKGSDDEVSRSVYGIRIHQVSAPIVRSVGL